MPKHRPTWKLSDVQKMKQEGKIRDYKVSGDSNESCGKKSRKAKYNNEKVEWDGQVFDSKREYKRYRELLLLLKAGKIGQLRMQVPYELNEGGTHSLVYKADFCYIDCETGEEIVEDIKGMLTATYKKKRRLMWEIYKIKILET